MSPIAIFWPMVAHFVLVGIIYVLLKWRRRLAAKSGAAGVHQVKVGSEDPDMIMITAHNLANQFELPMLFHIVCIGIFVTNGVSFTSLVLAWVFVLLRYAHAYMHVTSDDLRYPSAMFAAGFVVLVLLWGWFSLHLLGLV